MDSWIVFNCFLFLSSAKFYLGAVRDVPALLILFWGCFFSAIGGVLFFSLIQLWPILLDQILCVRSITKSKLIIHPNAHRFLPFYAISKIQHFFQINTSFKQFSKSPGKKKRAFKQALDILNFCSSVSNLRCNNGSCRSFCGLYLRKPTF